MKRRTFIIAAASSLCASVSVVSRSLVKNLLDTSLEYCVPAANMRDRVIAFRQNFINTYLLPKANFPIPQAMYQSKISPINNLDAKKLSARGAIEIKEITGQPNSRKLINNTGFALQPRFVASLNNQNIRLKVSIPKPLEIRADFDAHNLTFIFKSKVLFTLEDKIVKDGVPLPIFDQQVLESLSLSDTSMIYKFTENGTPGNKFTIKLDLTAQCAQIGRNLPFIVRHAINHFHLSWFTVLFYCLMSLSCITNNGGATDSCPQNCTETQSESELPRVTRPCNAAQSGILTENGAQYFRETRDLTNPSFCTFVRFENAPVNCQRIICSDVVPPSDWYEIDTWNDPNGCDHSTTLKNVKLVKRCYDINIQPNSPLSGDDSVKLPDAPKGNNYTQGLTASNVAPSSCPATTFTITKVSGNLPPGLKLKNNVLSGIPTASGTFMFIVSAIDNSSSCAKVQAYTLVVL